MFSKIVLVSCVLAVASAGLLPAAQYAPAAAVSSQSIIRHEQPHAVAPLAYHSAPVAYAAPAHYAANAAPAHYATYAAPAHYATYAAPAHYATQTVLRNNHGSLLAAAPAITLARSAPYLSATPALAHSAPLLHAAPQEIDTHPAYEYSYSVADSHTGDKKEQHEVRDGDAVQGSYSLLEADGSTRTVHYSADDHSGFNAVVSHSAPAAHPAPAPIAVAHAPILAYH